MIVASLLLVIAAAVTLVIGLFNQETVEWVYASIACCLVAGLLLTVGVVRSRPKRKPILQAGGEQPASWAGASSWPQNQAAGAAVLERDEAPTGDVRVIEEPPAPPPPPPAVDDTESMQPQPQPETADASPWAPEPEPAAEAAGAMSLEAVAEAAEPDMTPAQPESEAPAMADAATADAALAGEPAPQAAAAGAAARGRSSAAKTPASERDRFEAALSPIAGVGPTKRKALYESFGTLRKLKAATPQKIAETPGVSRVLAERILSELKK